MSKCTPWGEGLSSLRGLLDLWRRWVNYQIPITNYQQKAMTNRQESEVVLRRKRTGIMASVRLKSYDSFFKCLMFSFNWKIPLYNEVIMQKPYDLQERTFLFAKEVRKFCRDVPKKFVLIEDLKQLLRSSGSVGANYIEADEALSPKDRLVRLKICRKEAKESIYWLRLIEESLLPEDQSMRMLLQKEATELKLIIHTIITKSASNNTI